MRVPTAAVLALLLAAPPGIAQDRDGAEQTERIARRFRIGETGRLTLANISGDIVVSVGSGDEAAVEAVKRTRGSRGELASLVVEFDERPGRIDIRTRHTARRDRGRVDYTVTVPRQAMVEVSSISGEVRVSDVRGPLRAQSISGRVVVSGAANVELAKTISGDLELTGAVPDARLAGSTVSGTVRARDLRVRSLSLSAVSGDADAVNVEAERLEMKSVSGDVVFAGAVVRNARYEFGTHSGNVRLTLAPAPGFDLSASTFSGSIRSELPASIGDSGTRRGRGRSVRAVVGDGAATLSASTFSGNIVIRRQ